MGQEVASRRSVRLRYRRVRGYSDGFSRQLVNTLLLAYSLGQSI